MSSETLAALLGAALLVSSVAAGQAQTGTRTGTGTGMRSDLIWENQRAEEVGHVLGQRMKLEADRIGLH